MKHIFTVHSPLTFLMAYTIINDKSIPENDVIIISSGYKPPIEVPYLKKSFQDINKGFLKKLRTWNTPISYDIYIDHLTQGEEFIAYIDLMHIYQRILITHPKCKSFNFIEEGSASYIKASRMDEVTHVFWEMPYRYKSIKDFLVGFKFILRGYTMRVMTMPYGPENYRNFKDVKYYCLSPDAYPGVNNDKKVVLKLKSGDDLVCEMANNIILKEKHVWIEDSFMKFYDISEKTYSEAILSTIDYLKHQKSISRIHLKLRPSQSKEESIIYKHLIETDIEVEVINNDIIIEALLANSKNCIVIGNVSSVLFYAPLMGHKSISMFNKLKNRPHSAFDDFPVFWKNILKI